jgi:hypothetical protein
MEYTSNSSSIYDFNHLNFDFDYKNRFINCLFDNEKNFMFETPFLKVLKPLHVSNSKKNIETNKYIILETLNNLQNNNEFMIVVNKIHEISQENIKKYSKAWFNIELDDFGLDMKVRLPIDNQKNIQFIKIIIGNDQILLDKINNLEKNTYISMNIKYKGLRVLSDNLTEEWELIDFVSQDEYDKNREDLKNIEIESFLENKLNLHDIKNDDLDEVKQDHEIQQYNEINQDEEVQQIEEVQQVEEVQHYDNVQIVDDIQKIDVVQHYDKVHKINDLQKIDEVEVQQDDNVQKIDEVQQDDIVQKINDVQQVTNKYNNIKNNNNNKKKNNILEKNENDIILKNNVKYIKRKRKVIIW